MKAKEYDVMRMAVEAGIRLGIRRHYKHRDTCPTDEEIEQLANTIEDNVMTSVCEWFTFEEREDAT